MRFKTVLSAVFAALCLMTVSGLSFAAGEVVVVDMRTAIFKSDKGALEAEKLKAGLAQEQANLMALQAELKDIEARMSKDSAVMGEAELRKIKQNYTDKVSDYQHQGKKYQTKAKEAEQELSKTMLPEFQRALKSLIEEKKYGIVLLRDAVLAVSPEKDITEAVIVKMNMK